MNWFQRHLNWTYILAWGACLFIAFIVGTYLAISDTYATEKTMSDLSNIIAVVVMLPTSIWVLYRKKRSMWWLLLAGWFSPLWLWGKDE